MLQIFINIFFLSNNKHSKVCRLQGLLNMFQLFPTVYNIEMGVEKKMLRSRSKLLGIFCYVSHFSFVLEDNQSLFEDEVYIGCSLPFFAPLSLISLLVTTVEIPCSFAQCLFCFAKQSARRSSNLAFARHSFQSFK